MDSNYTLCMLVSWLLDGFAYMQSASGVHVASVCILLFVVNCQVAGVLEESVLYDKHQAAAAAAMASFKRNAMGEPELLKEFEERLAKGKCWFAVLLALGSALGDD